MVGLQFTVKCPECQEETMVDLGHTEYVKIDDSENEYTKCRCWKCGKPYWLSHGVNGTKDVRKVTGKEKLKEGSIICW